MPRILDLDPATYPRHCIHGEGRHWAETNCYADVVIELLHGLGFEPIAALPFTFTIDFDVDQWTFFKFPHADVEQLYGLGIYELAPWRDLAIHVEEQVGAGRPVLVELDSYFLPDTAGTAYKLAHVKSTVAVNAIDRDGERLGYFHNQGYHELSGQDFVDVLQTKGLAHERMLPPYIEFVKPLPGARPLRGADLVDGSLDVLRRQLARVPDKNPFDAFRTRFELDLPWLLASDIAVFHAYAFATVRQYGACFELSATYLRWLRDAGVALPAGVIDDFEAITSTTKTLQFQLARSMVRKRSLDLAVLSAMGEQWERGTSALVARFG
jgi:hypothetical protein